MKISRPCKDARDGLQIYFHHILKIKMEFFITNICISTMFRAGTTVTNLLYGRSSNET